MHIQYFQLIWSSSFLATLKKLRSVGKVINEFKDHIPARANEKMRYKSLILTFSVPKCKFFFLWRAAILLRIAPKPYVWLGTMVWSFFQLGIRDKKQKISLSPSFLVNYPSMKVIEVCAEFRLGKKKKTFWLFLRLV